MTFFYHYPESSGIHDINHIIFRQLWSIREITIEAYVPLYMYLLTYDILTQLTSNATALHWLIDFTIAHDIFERRRFSWFSVFVCLQIFRFYWYPWLEFVVLLYIFRLYYLPLQIIAVKSTIVVAPSLRSCAQWSRRNKDYIGVLQKNHQYRTQNV